MYGSFLRTAVVLLIWTSLLCLNTACVFSAKPQGTIRILSYNIHNGLGMDNKVDIDRISRLIASQKTDLIALQEVSLNYPGSSVMDPPAFLSARLGMTAYFAKTVTVKLPQKDPYDYGIALLSRYPVTPMGEILLPAVKRDKEPRKALIVRLETAQNRYLYFASTHFSVRSTPAEQQAQIRAILEEAKKNYYLPLVLAGDLNAKYNSKLLKDMRKDWYVFGNREKTFPSSRPSARLDYICGYPKDAFMEIGSKVIPDSIASDHRPVFSEIILSQEKK